MDLLATRSADIVTVIRSGPTAEIVAPTGTGKSLLIPLLVAVTGSKVLISMPTRTATRSLHSTVSALLRRKSRKAEEKIKTLTDELVRKNTAVTDIKKRLTSEQIRKNVEDTIKTTTDARMSRLKVGYAAESEVSYESDTDIIYATSGHVRRLMLSSFREGEARSFGRISVLIVDEIHNGSVDNSIILALWMEAHKQGLQRSINVPRLILITATPVPFHLEPKPERFTLKIDSYPVDLEYSDRDYEDEREVISAMAKRVVSLHQNNPLTAGSFLLFVSGSAEVEILLSLLQQNQLRNVVLMAVHGSMSDLDSDALVQPAPSGHRKIVISTNMAESSITIPDIGFVLDSMREKRPGTSASGDLILSLTFISKKSADQRKGRTGRTGPGKCIRFITEASYRKLEESRPFDIKKVPIHNEVMEIYGAGLQPEKILADVGKEKLSETITRLLEFGMIKDDRSVTDMGHFAARLPLSVRMSAFLWRWLIESYPAFPGIVIAALINSEPSRLFLQPRRLNDISYEQYQQQIRDFRERNYKHFVGANHLITCLNVWESMMDSTSNNGLFRNRFDQVRRWADENSISFGKMKDIINSINTIKSVCASHLGTEIEIGGFSPVRASERAIPVLEKCHLDRVMTLSDDDDRDGHQVYRYSSDRGYYLDSKGTRYIMDTRNRIPGFSNYRKIISLINIDIENDRRLTRLITMAVPQDRNEKIPFIEPPAVPRAPLAMRTVDDYKEQLQPSRRRKDTTGRRTADRPALPAPHQQYQAPHQHLPSSRLPPPASPGNPLSFPPQQVPSEAPFPSSAGEQQQSYPSTAERRRGPRVRRGPVPHR